MKIKVPEYQPHPWLRAHPEAKGRFVGLVGCGKAKLTVKSPARSLYKGSLTKMALGWVERNCTDFCILSALWGVLDPDEMVDPYNVKMADLDDEHRTEWGKDVRKKLKKKFPGREFLVVAGGDYVRALCLGVDLLGRPGFGLFQRMKWLKDNPVLTDELLEWVVSRD